MNVQHKHSDDLNAVITLEIKREDYIENYNNSLKTAKKNIQLPGFRNGHVPTSLVEKKYGPSIIGEELDKLISESLGNYIKDNDLDVLGQPLPLYKENADKNDFEKKGDFEFQYEIGLAPKFDIKVDKSFKIDYHKIDVNQELIDKQKTDFAKRYGALTSVEKAGENDMIVVEFSELNDKDEIVESGFKHQSTVAIEFTEDKKTKKKLIGLKVGDTLVESPQKLSRGTADMSAMLNISKQQAEHYSNNVFMKIVEVKQLKPAEINQELIDKIYGKDKVEGEKELEEKIKEDLVKNFETESDNLFKRTFSEKVRKKLKLSLPDEFLKKWILATNKETTKEQIENEYENYKEMLKWQLIENKIITDNNLKVEENEPLEYAKNLMIKQYTQYGLPVPEDTSELDKLAGSVLQNQEEAKRIYDALFHQKMVAFLKETVAVKDKTTSFDDFVVIANK